MTESKTIPLPKDWCEKRLKEGARAAQLHEAYCLEIYLGKSPLSGIRIWNIKHNFLVTKLLWASCLFLAVLVWRMI